MPVYKDNAANRKLDRVGKTYGYSGPRQVAAPKATGAAAPKEKAAPKAKAEPKAKAAATNISDINNYLKAVKDDDKKGMLKYRKSFNTDKKAKPIIEYLKTIDSTFEFDLWWNDDGRNNKELSKTPQKHLERTLKDLVFYTLGAGSGKYFKS